MQPVDNIKFGLVQQITSTIDFGPLDIAGELRIRFIIENATIANTIVVKAKIKGQDSFDTLATLTGNAAQTINVNVYDYLFVYCTVYSSATNYVKISASGFGLDEGDAIKAISFPGGGTIENAASVAFTSSNNSVHIVGDSILNTIDFTVNAASNPNAYATFATPAGTNPSANSSGDTITFLSTDSNIVITGNAGAETVDFTAGTGITNNLVRAEYRTLSAGEFVAKQLTLANTPTVNTKTRLTIVGGVEQKYSTDFIVIGNILSWSGLGLDGLIEQNDSLIITYP